MFKIMCHYNNITVELKRVNTFLEAQSTIKNYSTAFGYDWQFWFE